MKQLNLTCLHCFSGIGTERKMRLRVFISFVIWALQTLFYDCEGRRIAGVGLTRQTEYEDDLGNSRLPTETETKHKVTRPSTQRVDRHLARLTASAGRYDGETEEEQARSHKDSHTGITPPYATQVEPRKEIAVTRSSWTNWRFKREGGFKRIRRDSQPSAEPEPTLEPNSEPESSAEPKSTSEPNGGKGEPQQNPKPESTAEPEPEPEDSWPEPGPEWPSALDEWQAAWPLHTYGFASVFSLIAVVQSAELVRIFCQRERKTPLKLSLMIMIIIFASIRAIVLFGNPYGLTGNFPPTATRLLSSIGQPCIIAAVSLLLLVLIDTTKMNIAPPRFQSVTFIVPVITLHVLLVVASDVIVAHYLQVKFLLLFCQLYFLITGLALTLGYACVGWKISRNVASNTNQSGDRSQDGKMTKLQRLIFAFTVTSAMLLAVTIYGAAGVFGIYSNVTYVDAWPWWGLQTAFRCLETTMCVLLLIMNINTNASRTSCFTKWTRCWTRKSRVGAWTRDSTTADMTYPHSTSHGPTIPKR